MAATVQIHGWHGAAPGSGSNITSAETRFKTADNDTVDTNNPVVIPDSGTNFSYLKNERLNAQTTPASIIDNLKYYTDGVSWGTGITVHCKVSDTYVDPVANGTTEMTGGTDETTYTSGSPLSLTGSISNPNTGNFGQFVVRQARVGSTASPGIVTGKTQYFRYDEI